MIVKVLVENRAISSEWKKVHGLSLFIETKKHQLLFDLGPSDCLLENSMNAGIDLKMIDLVVISHGHQDHGGALGYFININNSAPIYIRKHVFDHHYSLQPKGVQKEIGLDIKNAFNQRFVMTDGIEEIDDELTLFPTMINMNPSLVSNKNLFKQTEGIITSDNFDHEQHLLIHCDQKYVLVSGCSHGGIVNIIETAKTIIGKDPDIVIGGFHLSSTTGLSVSESEVKSLALKLQSYHSKFYTCHCTGIMGYQVMKSIMKDQLDYISTGNIVLI